MADPNKPLRAKKGDIYIKLQGEGGDSVTVLVEARNVQPYHRDGLKKLYAVLSTEMFAPDSPKSTVKNSAARGET